jgi:hypothetical protein
MVVWDLLVTSRGLGPGPKSQGEAIGSCTHCPTAYGRLGPTRHQRWTGARTKVSRWGYRQLYSTHCSKAYGLSMGPTRHQRWTRAGLKTQGEDIGSCTYTLTQYYTCIRASQNNFTINILTWTGSLIKNTVRLVFYEAPRAVYTVYSVPVQRIACNYSTVIQCLYCSSYLQN